MTGKVTATAPNGEVVSRSTDRPYGYAILVAVDKDVKIRRALKNAERYEARAAVCSQPREIVPNPNAERWPHSGLFNAPSPDPTIASDMGSYGAFYRRTADGLVRQEVETREEFEARLPVDLAKAVKKATGQAKRARKEAARLEAIPGDVTYVAVSWHRDLPLAQKALAGRYVPAGAFIVKAD